VNTNASGSLTAAASTAWASAPQGSAPEHAEQYGGRAAAARAAAIAYFTSASYVTPSASGLTGSPLFVQVDAASCNTDPTRVLTAPVTLTSRLTGDVEILTAVENAPNTGLSHSNRTYPPPTPRATCRSGDGIVEVLPNDVVTATVTHCGAGDVRRPPPVDRPGGLLIDKTADRITAQVGDFVDYAIKLTMPAAQCLPTRSSTTACPRFVYVSGSARTERRAAGRSGRRGGPALRSAWVGW